MLEVFYGFKIKSQIEERGFVIYLKSRHCIDLKSHSQASSPRRDSLQCTGNSIPAADPSQLRKCNSKRERPKQLTIPSLKKIP